MTLGRYEPKGTDIPEPYTEIAEAEKDTYFDLGKNWKKLEEKYGFSDDDMFELFNIPALDDAVKAGKPYASATTRKHLREKLYGMSICI